MSNYKKLFEDFEPVSLKEWIEKVEKDLKGKSFSELEWELEEELRMPPFSHKGQLPEYPPIHDGANGNDWQIGSYIEVKENLKIANRDTLEALEGGVEAPLFLIDRTLDTQEFDLLFKNIEAEFISLHFGWENPCETTMTFLQNFMAYLKKNDVDSKKTRGSLGIGLPTEKPKESYEVLSDVLKFGTSNLPAFKLFKIEGHHFYKDMEHTTEELALIIQNVNAFLSNLTDWGHTPEAIAKKLTISIAIDNSYFVSIAKIRALKLLMNTLLKAYKIPDPAGIEIEAHFAKSSQKESKEDNMIRATTQAMSAIIGGVNRLYVLASDVNETQEEPSFGNRIARNLQHILKMESFFDKVADPAAGSYYIEMLTTRLAEKAWERFKGLVG